MYPILELVRLEESIKTGTLGVLKINKAVFCVTLEPADRLNEELRSSIPAQQYLCTPVMSPKFGSTYEISGVPGRSHVLFHPGNVLLHTSGCILLAQHWGKLHGDRAILNSGSTFKAFLAHVAGAQKLHLTIREVY